MFALFRWAAVPGPKSPNPSVEAHTGVVSSGNPEFLIPLMSGQMSLKAVQGEHHLEIAFREVPCPSVGGKKDGTCRLQRYFMAVCAFLFTTGQSSRPVVTSEEHS